MDNILLEFLSIIKTGGSEAFGAAGWLLFLVERYYVAASREKQHREDLIKHKEEHKFVNDKVTEVLTKFMVIMEVMKDRINRGGS